MAMRTVNLVFGPKTRVVPVRAAEGRVTREIIGRAIKTGESLLGVIGHSRGVLTPGKANQILSQRFDVISASRGLAIEVPEMLNLSDKLSIMMGEATVGLFKQVMAGYEITGHNADRLKAILADPKQAGNALTYVSLNDAREFAKRLSDLTGRKFRVQTEAEWLQAKDKLTGANHTWTETSYSDNTFVLRRLGIDFRYVIIPVSRYSNGAVRLVEDL